MEEEDEERGELNLETLCYSSAGQFSHPIIILNHFIPMCFAPITTLNCEVKLTRHLFGLRAHVLSRPSTR